MLNRIGIVLLLASSSPAWAAKALVYQGPGVCEEGCGEAAAEMARQVGLTPVMVSPTNDDPLLFADAAVWIQPGGNSRAAARAMTKQLKERIKDFVQGGAGFVGYCAGGFIATAQIGDTNEAGLGLLPGRSSLYKGVTTESAIVQLGWNGQVRQLYWEGGPAFYPPFGGAGLEVTATYEDGTAASVRADYGSGRVSVTGVHPEAPQAWRDFYHLIDTDGLDYDLATDMIRWAARL